METKDFVDLYSGRTLAEKYLKYRPDYPQHIAEEILTHLRKLGAKTSESGTFSRMLDVGCGSGQATFAFASFFDSILALDISADQIEMGKRVNKFEHISFQQMLNKRLPVEDQSVDFINCASAAHLFDIKFFESECQRVLKPNGCVAMYFRSLKSIQTFPVSPAPNQDELNLEFQRMGFRFLRKIGMHPKMEICEKKYVPIYEQLVSSSKFWMNGLEFYSEWTLKDFRQFRTTNGEYHKFMEEKKPESDPLDDLINEIKKLLNVEDKNEDVLTKITWSVPTIIFNKE